MRPTVAQIVIVSLRDTCGLQRGAEASDGSNLPGESAARLHQAHGGSGIDAFEEHRLLADIEYLLVPEHRLDVMSMQNASQEPPAAAVDRDPDLTQGLDSTGANRSKCLGNLPQPGDAVCASDDHAVRGRDDLIGPREPGWRKIDQDQIVTPGCETQECIERREVHFTKVELAARGRENVQTAGVAADEDLEQLGIESLGIVQDL